MINERNQTGINPNGRGFEAASSPDLAKKFEMAIDKLTLSLPDYDFSRAESSSSTNFQNVSGILPPEFAEYLRGDGDQPGLITITACSRPEREMYVSISSAGRKLRFSVNQIVPKPQLSYMSRSKSGRWEETELPSNLTWLEFETGLSIVTEIAKSLTD